MGKLLDTVTKLDPEAAPPAPAKLAATVFQPEADALALAKAHRADILTELRDGAQLCDERALVAHYQQRRSVADDHSHLARVLRLASAWLAGEIH